MAEKTACQVVPRPLLSLISIFKSLANDRHQLAGQQTAWRHSRKPSQMVGLWQMVVLWHITGCLADRGTAHRQFLATDFLSLSWSLLSDDLFLF